MTHRYENAKLKIFTLNSNKKLAEEIAKEVGVPLGKSTVTRFSDGEVQINIEESIRGCDVFIVQSTSGPVNENIMELLINPPKIKKELKLRKMLTGLEFNLSPIIVLDEIKTGRYIIEANSKIYHSSIELAVKI